MTRSVLRGALGALAAAVAAASPAAAEPIGAGVSILTAKATQTITLADGNPFTGVTTVIPIVGYGEFVLERDAQVGDTIAVPRVSGLFYGGDPTLGTFVFGSIDPFQPTDFDVSITDVVQDPADPGFAAGLPSSLASGTLHIGGPSFGLEFTSGPLTGVRVYSDPAVGFGFVATLDGLPPSSGTPLVSVGTDAIPIRFGSLTGPIIGTTSDRQITFQAIPEPSSLALVGLGAAGLGIGRAAHRRRRAAA